MILVDTSAWAELFRRTGSRVDMRLRSLLDDPEQVAVTEVVVMELLAGARSTRQLRGLRRFTLVFPLLSAGGLDGYEHAAELYRLCRAGGETVRKLTDCLIAVPAIRAGVPVLHADRDFDVIARHTPLEVFPLDA
ncbi:MAG TPA: PIN domain nuclease [Gaiellaceae bacterium]|nr:PIN domain nuclease [Gaiellaceae bacterium]